jgi:hypothetical protein
LVFAFYSWFIGCWFFRSSVGSGLVVWFLLDFWLFFLQDIGLCFLDVGSVLSVGYWFNYWF